MNRVPYRRVTPPRNDTFETPEEKNEGVSAGETVMAQLVISGVLVILVFFIGIMNVGPLVSFRNGLRQALAGATTVGELAEEIRHFGYEWQNAGTDQGNDTLDLPLFDLPNVLLEPIESIESMITANETTNETADETPSEPTDLESPGLWD